VGALVALSRAYSTLQVRPDADVFLVDTSVL
jgi:hypothetical protein